jgi:cell surface protein SprA
MPNWSLTYDGLSRIPALKKLFQNIIITHGYTSLFTVGNFASDPRFNLPEFMTGAERDLSNNFLSEYEIGTVSITEQFNPLINIDISWHNSLITRFEYRKSRNITLSLANNQLTDMNSNEMIVGTGYRIRDLSFSVTSGGSRRRITSDLILRLDLSVRDNKTVLRKLVEEVDLVSSGQRIFTLQSSAEYQLSSTATFRFFFDRTINTPFISNQYKNVNTNAGISLRFMLR